ncbi:MAG: acetoacetate decarboxylase family protein, partial [Steroidobacteraceae bacterium]
MLQPDNLLPDVPRVPAPWSLQGNGWIVLLRLPRAAPARSDFVATALQPTLWAPVSLLMFVDYLGAPCGPYRELLFIPGALRFADGRRHASISRIFVSTWASVVNGRANWGIPKDRADFAVTRGGERDRLAVADEKGREFCRLDFESPRGPRLPLRTS